MDALRDTLSAAFAESETETTTAAPAPATTVAAEPSAPSDEASSAAPESSAPAEKTSDTDIKSIEEVAGDKSPEKTDETTTEKVVEKVVDPRIDRAPASWKGDAKKVWAELPLAARQEVIRRERDTSRVLQESAQDRQRVSQIQEVLAPHMDRIKEVYQGNPLTAINNLMGVERTLMTGDTNAKAQLVANMINHFKIDVGVLDSLLSGQASASAQPDQLQGVEQLISRKLQPMMSFIERQQQIERQQAQQAESQMASAVEQMATDPKFPYFEEVRAEMADIIEIAAKRGVTISLPEAYEKAVRMNDDTYQASGAREASQSNTQAALQAHQAAQKAKGAAVSVSGSPSGNGINAGNVTDLRGTIASAMESMGGRL